MFKKIMSIVLIFNISIAVTPSLEVEKTFTHIMDHNSWGSKESVSGNGSTLKRTEAIRRELPVLIRSLTITSMCDAPCGDFNWIKKIINRLPLTCYIGIDVVQKLVDQNNKLHGNKKIKFKQSDIIKSQVLPKVDLILCRDCLVHLPYEDILSVLRNFKNSRSTYILMTNFVGERTFIDIKIGQWRPINFQKPLFNFPVPLTVINEKNGKPFADKTLSLWRLGDILVE